MTGEDYLQCRCHDPAQIEAFSSKITTHTEVTQERKGIYNVGAVTIILDAMLCAGIVEKIAMKALKYLGIYNILVKAQ